MKLLSKTLTELGIEFTFPLEIKDANGKRTYYENSKDYWAKWGHDDKGHLTYYENSDGFLRYWERDANGKATYYKDSSGVKSGTPRSAKTCEGKVVEIDGIKYELKAL